MTFPPRRRQRSSFCVALLVSAALVLTACSGDPEGEEGPNGTGGPAESPGLVTEASLGSVTGELGEADQAALVEQATGLVEAYTDWAFLSGDYPRTEWSFPAPGFTKRANRRLEQLDLTLATNADIGVGIDTVTPISREVVVDVLAPKGEPAGVTARFTLEFGTDGDAGPSAVRVTGRLILVDSGTGWQIVGYYLAKGPVL